MPDTSVPRGYERILVPVLFILAVACYGNTLNHSFVYDDNQQILQNPYIKSWHFLPDLFSTTVWSYIGSAGVSNYYRPLMTLTYLILWKSFGELPFGFHLFNILLNGLVVVAVYYAGRNLFRDSSVAALAALLFAVHPIHTEAVSWIAAVPDLEATFLVLIAFSAYVNTSRSPSPKRALAVAAFLLALLAKEPALMLAPLLILYEHFVRDDRGMTPLRLKISRYLPICVAGFCYLLFRAVMFGKLAAMNRHPEVTGPQTIYSGFALAGEYVKLLFWSAPLSAFHVFRAGKSLLELPVLAGVAIASASVILACASYKQFPAVAFSLAWIGITLAPVLNARWMATNVLAERYLYLPSVGFCWVAGWLVKRTWRSLGTNKTWQVPAKAGFAAAIAGVLALGCVRTMARNRDWRDDITLYTRTLQTDPDSYVMHLNLGTAYLQRRNLKEAEKELNLALILKPDSANVLNALGCLYLEQGKLQEAAERLQAAVALRPLWSDPHFNYGRVLRRIGRPVQGRQEFRESVELGPLNSTARFYLAQSLAEDGQTNEAEGEYRRSIELDPSLDAEHGLIDILLKSGRTADAEEELRRLLKRDGFDGTAHLKLAKLLEGLGRTPEALAEYRMAQQTDELKVEAEDAIKRLTPTN
jgi:protein O-mannosyl-transferase